MSFNEQNTTVTITDKQDTSSDRNDSDDKNEAVEVTTKDLFLYFFLGATTLLIKGLSITPSFSKAIGIQNTQVPQAGLAFALGALLGIVIVTTFYTKLRPKKRVGISAGLEFIGLLLMCIPIRPVNWWLGLIVMAMGVGSMIGTIMPLTSYASGKATKAFQLGFALSNLLGALTSKIFQINMPKFVMIIIILIFPLLNLGTFLSLDQSPWDHICNSTSSDQAKDNDKTGKSEINEEDLSGIPVSNDNGRELSIDFDTDDNTKDQEPLSKDEKLCAVKQMLFRYWPIFLIAGVTQQLFQLTVLFPFESSSFTYGGMATDQVSTTGSTLTIIAFTCSFLFGLTVLTKIGRIISTMNPYLLWIPSSIMVLLVGIVFIGVTYGAFPPLQYAPYFIYPVVFVSYQSIQIYSPLIIRNDEKLNPRFAELQLQTLYLMNYLSVFIVATLGTTFLAQYVLDGCNSNYGQQYDGVSCIAMLGS
jgi:MFS family permease